MYVYWYTLRNSQDREKWDGGLQKESEKRNKVQSLVVTGTVAAVY